MAHCVRFASSKGHKIDKLMVCPNCSILLQLDLEKFFTFCATDKQAHSLHPPSTFPFVHWSALSRWRPTKRVTTHCMACSYVILSTKNFKIFLYNNKMLLCWPKNSYIVECTDVIKKIWIRSFGVISFSNVPIKGCQTPKFKPLTHTVKHLQNKNLCVIGLHCKFRKKTRYLLIQI